MHKISSIEIITTLFISISFEVARSQHPEVEDEVDLLPYVCDLLRQANDRYNECIHAGAIQNDAVYEVFLMFTEITPSVASRRKRWFW